MSAAQSERSTWYRAIGQRLYKVWRVLGTGFSFAVFGFGAFIIGLVFFIINLLPFSQQFKQKIIRLTIRWACRFYILMMRALGLLTYRLNVAIPAAVSGRVIIANHPTLLDAVFMLAVCDNVCCIVKEALWNNPCTAIVVRLAGYIPNNSAGFIEVAARKIAQGENILIFPEGTRNLKDGELPFKRGASNIAVISGCSIVPVVIQCHPRTLQKYEKWYQVPSQPPVFTLCSKPIIQVSDCIDLSRPNTIQYRQLTYFLQQLYQGYL